MSDRLSYSRKIFLLILATGTPGLLAAFWFIWYTDWTVSTRLLVLCLLTGAAAGLASAAYESVVHPLRTLSSVVAALREGDFSIEARGARPDDPLGQVMEELNGLSENLREQRLNAIETSTLLRKVMEEINVAVFTFNDHQQLRLTNRAGERLLAQPMERLQGLKADELGLSECLKGESIRVQEMTFPSGTGRWGIRYSQFRQGGLPHSLLLVADLSLALREEERLAWQRLLRVLGHELNNSLAPIKSLSGSLATIFSKDPLPNDWKEDTQRGLQIIASRTAALSRFTEAYSRLARLPLPRMHPVSIGEAIHRIVELETRVPITVEPGPDFIIQADGDQLEQILINLIRNAADAALETHGQVRVRWLRHSNRIEIQVEDEGIGLSNTSNLFVPFFTTKPGGSGIGLVISRQIAEAHQGNLTLENRKECSGCVARLYLPLNQF